MSVRISADFWENYNEYKKLIIRCVVSIYNKKYKLNNVEHNSGVKTALAQVLVDFERKDIFGKFDPDKEGKRTTTVIENKTAGKKLQQYIYKNVESVLYAMYHKERKYSERNVMLGSDSKYSVDNLNENNYGDYKVSKGISHWDSSSDEVVGKKNKDRDESGTSLIIKNAPTIDDAYMYRSEHIPSPEENLQAVEVEDFILSILKDEREAKIIEAKKMGLNNTDIGKMVNLSSPQIANILKSIRGRCQAIL